MISLQDELKIFKKETINTYYNDALALVKDNNISKAIELMERSLNDITEDVETLNLMGICQYILCNFDKASLYWNKSLMANNQGNRARYYLDYLKSDKYKGFIEYYNLSISYIDKFKYKDAIELLLEINKTNKDLIEPYALIGISYYALQEHDLAKKYLEKALSKDIDNLKYLRYLNKVNSNVPLKEKKGKLNYRIKLNYKILLPLIALIVVTVSTVFFQKYNKDIKALSSELDRSKSENNKLEEQLKDEKNKEKKEKKKEKDEEDKNDDTEVKDDTDNKDLNFSGSEAEILENAMEDFTNKEYSQSIDKFQYLISTAQNEDLVAESIYFIAVCFEKEKDYDKAEEYYSSYIDKYDERSYYDDSLYNYGLMLYEKGDIEASKKILYKLKKEEPDSEFVNSKVKSILEN